MKILITENAEKSYFEIISKYSENKTASFSKNTISILDIIKENNHIGHKYKKTLYRKFLLTEQIYIFYKIESEIIYIVLFWDNKRNPLNLDVVLNS
ncbi:hypothetical protein [Flavobacterium sp. CF136]|uniref:hypothetical protein n=1 Tax=Flavobacterium sp. (strain CF136) TaxID=1144313 RepID=UPI0002716B8B|nr:hypothetical protein [Flavobacterium sp. CF136]EJL65004.1 hypothetical protein PMI10_01555 [Flavobacterium sp. CF136]